MTARWRSHLIALGVAIAALLALFWRDLFGMINIWWNVSTYNHALFIPAIVGWLIWQRREELMRLEPRSWWWGLVPVAGAGLLWVLGGAGGISLFRHIALVAAVQALTLAVLGPTVTRAILFPLFYLIFLVPVGEEIMPQMQMITADMCMFLLNLVGVPAKMEGVFITTPVGLFEVAEACSGVKFLIAMVAYSTLVANVCFKSWKRRILFLAMACIVPILANGFRAFSTIWISELSGSVDFAASVDHIIYGWVFFALVMGIVMAIGWRWFDRGLDELWAADVKPDGKPASRLWLKAGAAVAVLGVLVAGQYALASLGQRPMEQAIAMPDVPGWKRVAIESKFAWNPRFDGADHIISGQYQNGAGQRVDLVIALFAWQQDGREMVGYAQGAFDPRTNWAWMQDANPPTGGKADLIRSPAGPREVLSFYWIGNTLTGSASRVKIETLKTRLLGQDQAAAALLVSAEEGQGAPARGSIDAFIKALGSVDGLSQRLIRQAQGQG